MGVRRRSRDRAVWFAGPALLLAVGSGVWVVRAGPIGLFGTVLAVLVALPLVWILASALWPARADRGCPECGGEHLRRIDPRATTGVVCAECGYRDETASAWLIAEEEGPLEEIVLKQRARKRRARSGVDSRTAAH